MQQLKSEAATIRWRSNGAFTCPMVVRVPIGGYLTGGSIWHSQSGESIFAHIPGLLIAFPSRARDAAGLLRAAFRCEDPVLFLEHKHLLRQPYTRDPYPPADYIVPFGVADVRRPGRDRHDRHVGSDRREVAAGGREGQGGDRTRGRGDRPQDDLAVGPRVRRRVRAAHTSTASSCTRTCSPPGSAARSRPGRREELWGDLEAPIRRVAALDTHVAYEPTLEQAILPQVDDIVGAIDATIAAG